MPTTPYHMPPMTKESQRLRSELRVRCSEWAAEGAKEAIAFAFMSGTPKMDPETVKQALIQYAVRGAQEAFDGLERHGHLSIR